MTKPKLCIECVHGGGSIRMPPLYCRRQLGERVRDPVSGRIEDDWIIPLCRSERKVRTWLGRMLFRERCGPEGQFYEYAERAPPPPPSKFD